MTRRSALLLGALSAFGAAACASDATSIQIQYAMSDQPTSSCTVSDSSSQRGGGSVDLGNTSQYFAALQLVSALDSKDLTAAGETVNPGTRNNFLIETLTLSYAAQGLSIADQQIRAAGMVPAGGKLSLGLALLTGPAVAKLLPFAMGVAKNVTVSIKIGGKFANGSSYETAAFDFPLVVYVGSTLACSGLATIGAVGEATPPACSNWGQDGVPFACHCTDCAGTCSAVEYCDTTACACKVCDDNCVANNGGDCSDTQTCDLKTCRCVASSSG